MHACTKRLLANATQKFQQQSSDDEYIVSVTQLRSRPLKKYIHVFNV